MRRVDKQAFGERVARRRQALDLTQDELARNVGMKQQGIDSIESGEVARPRLLRELANALRTSENWLLWREGPEEVEQADQGDPTLTWVPVVSWVAAGKLADAGSDIPVEDVQLLAFAGLGRGQFFALKVQGDSMDRISPEGSIIVVNRAERDLIGERCYVFSLRGETTYKLWRPNPPHLAPHSTNPANTPIFIRRRKDFEVVGRVRRSVLDL